MRRVFLKDFGPFKAGDDRDYPLGTWKSFFPDFEKLTRTVEEVLKDAVKKFKPSASVQPARHVQSGREVTNASHV